MFVSESVPIPT